ncbi:receptor-interacting serine/threonine-protein kinase 3-like [Amphiura filiformis]|uniref:receptor-interacting serine/threonine-protein kinase 3-like n=1 Tax=Amphiura filiformis TaxID=82378 RepID=UPI003B214220
MIRELGRGGFGAVWLAKHNLSEVAVKKFDKRLKDDVLREAQKMQKAINSEYLVRLLGIIIDPKCYAIIMDYIEHGNLKSFMPNLKCDCWPRRIRIIYDIAAGMDHLHHLNPPIVHKDLKASNIFISGNFMAKLGDLGLSVTANKFYADHTTTGIGTVSHIPPEAWAGTEREAKPSLDIYEYGITLFEISSGLDPWPPCLSDPQVTIRGLVYTDDKRPNETDVMASTPDEIRDLMKKCWQRDPTSRPTSKVIVKQVAALFEQRYETGLEAADHAIRIRLFGVDRRNEQESKKHSSPDSGMGSDISGNSGHIGARPKVPPKTYKSIDKLNSPEKPKAENIGNAKIRITWSTPMTENGSPVSGYVLEILDVKQEKWSTIEDNVSSTKYSTTDVKPGMEYQFRVSARNKEGVISKPSEPSNIIKPYDKPDAPGTPIGEIIDNAKIKITWSPPMNDNGAPISGYIVEKFYVNMFKQGKWSTIKDKV